MPERQFAVLIADDDEKDRALLTKTIRRHASHLKVVGEVANGEEVVAYLTGEGEYADREKNPLPKLLILDVRMPRMTGIEVLEWLRAQGFPDLKVALLADSSTSILRINVYNLRRLRLRNLPRVQQKHTATVGFRPQLRESLVLPSQSFRRW